MRNLVKGDVLHVRAIGGLHVVTLAWDFVPAQEAKHEGLLGFAIERSEIKDGQVVERYFIRGIKRFKHKDEGLAPGTPVPTSEHPIQTFQWGDYTARPSTTYEFKVIPVYGKPKLLELDEGSATTIEITTEAEQGGENVAKPSHDIYFNRGAAGSQAFARKFGKAELDEDDPASEPMAWLSRGLFEALIKFIGVAAGEDAADYKLRAMLYEFRYKPVGLAFKEAKNAGADVDVRYEAQSYKEENEEMIAAARIKSICKPQKSREGIRHNKFIILIHKNVPVAVWTGSTNISAGGIFGHSNVGHVIWDRDLARSYLEYWERLANPKVTLAPLKKANLAAEPTPAPHTLPPDDRMLTLYSPRDNKGDEKTLEWYAGLIADAKRIACVTFAFNLDQYFHDVLVRKDSTLRYALFDKDPGDELADEIKVIGNTVIAPGAKLSKGDLEFFLGEKLTGFNRNYYVHDKFMLIDPLGRDPIVVTGTANFSRPSQNVNDENMLVIRGNQRVADVYFGEFMRVFDHFYSRYVVKRIKEQGSHDPDAGFLKEDWTKWVPGHFKEGPKKLRREAFMNQN
ncbi:MULTISPECIES: phospholipase D-like domain-containing protein [unclassified Bradyrhizobium]|uniref:phospholipase D-like domain-containing protein n=1 Tax=unclassified Bradyrhizobium TaxID=2631580 RepID=UPI002FEF914F